MSKVSPLNLQTHEGQRALYGYHSPERRLVSIINDLVTYAGVSFDKASKKELGEKLINGSTNSDAYHQLDPEARTFYVSIGHALRRNWMEM